MAFTEASLTAQLSPAGTGRTITLQAYIPGETFTDVYAIGVVAPYAGRSRWVNLTNSNSAKQAAMQIVEGLA